MSGIVGYIGPRDAASILVEGLRRLEHRGYDASSIAVLNGQVHVVESQGRLERLEESLKANPIAGRVGIAHTRWATHGALTGVDAQPHHDCSGRFVVVHNGILENEEELRAELLARGHRFKSETDTEILTHLIEEYYQGDLRAAVCQALQRVRGSYALVVVSSDHPGQLLAARKENPLVVGVGEGEMFLASDIPAVLQYTRQFCTLRDGEVASVTESGVEVFGVDGSSVRKEVVAIEWDPTTAERDGYEHFMLKEIYEQPQALINAIRGRISMAAQGIDVRLEGVTLSPDQIRAFDQVMIVGCGTAYHAGLLGQAYIRQLAGLRADIEIASEFRYGDPDVGPNTLAIFISQSGETADTLGAMREAKRRGCTTLAIVNAAGSTAAAEADHVILTHAGPEIAIASTKAYVTQVVCLLQLALYLGQVRGTLPADTSDLFAALRALPAATRRVIEVSAERLRSVAAEWKGVQSAFFIGRGLDHAVAREGQLKLKETSYIHAEALAAGELRHGPIALVANGMPVVAIATQPTLYEKMASIMKEVRERGGRVVGVAMADDRLLQSASDELFVIPKTHALLAPILAIVPLQILSYEVAKIRGCDVDKPRNLSKSVTVD